jgi:hypothetical protein
LPVDRYGPLFTSALSARLNDDSGEQVVSKIATFTTHRAVVTVRRNLLSDLVHGHFVGWARSIGP